MEKAAKADADRRYPESNQKWRERVLAPYDIIGEDEWARAGLKEGTLVVTWNKTAGGMYYKMNLKLAIQKIRGRAIRYITPMRVGEYDLRFGS
jgi:hypothetical protein